MSLFGAFGLILPRKAGEGDREAVEGANVAAACAGSGRGGFFSATPRRTRPLHPLRGSPSPASGGGSKLIAAVAAALALSGCAAVADRLTPVDANVWRPGVTTEAQLVDALGPYAERSFLPDGGVLLRWRGRIGVRGQERLTYGFVVSPSGVLVRRAEAAELRAPGL